MVDYKIYFLNLEGHIVSATDLAAKTDDEAIEEAERLALGDVFELWERARCIVPGPATGRSSAPSS